MEETAIFIIWVVCISLKQAYRHMATVPAHAGDRVPAELHVCFEHINFLSFLFDSIIFLSLSLFALDVSGRFTPISAFFIILSALVFVLALSPRVGSNRLSVWAAGRLSGAFAYLISRFIRPLSWFENFFGRINSRLHKAEPYSRKALIKFLNEQEAISEGGLKEDLKLALSALGLNEQKASHLMVREAKAKFVDINEHVGPVLLSELHSTGRKIFPVKDASEIIGTVKLDSLAELKSGGKVSGAFNSQMTVINRTDTPTAAIRRFLDSSAELLFIKDDSGKVIGVLYLEDILEELIGE